MKKFILLALCVLLCGLANADRSCNLYQEKRYNDLLARAKQNDRDAMLELSTMYCDDCSKTLDSCVKDAVKWLKAAAAKGQPEAERLIDGLAQQTAHGRALYRSQDLKNGKYEFRSYHDNIGYIAYYEILKNNKVIFIPDNQDMLSQGQFPVINFEGVINDNNQFDDHTAILAIVLNTGGHASEGEMRYFSLGKQLRCLINKKTQSPYWTYSRFDDSQPSVAAAAYKLGTAEWRNCEEVVQNA